MTSMAITTSIFKMGLIFFKYGLRMSNINVYIPVIPIAIYPQFGFDDMRTSIEAKANLKTITMT